MRIKGAGDFMFFLLLLAASGFMVGAQSQPSFSVYTMNIISNTVYLNSNSTVLYVYAGSTNSLQSYLSLNGSVLSPVFNSSTQTLVVPSNAFYMFNYTGTGYFTGQFINESLWL